MDNSNLLDYVKTLNKIHYQKLNGGSNLWRNDGRGFCPRTMRQRTNMATMVTTHNNGKLWDATIPCNARLVMGCDDPHPQWCSGWLPYEWAIELLVNTDVGHGLDQKEYHNNNTTLQPSISDMQYRCCMRWAIQWICVHEWKTKTSNLEL